MNFFIRIPVNNASGIRLSFCSDLESQTCLDCELWIERRDHLQYNESINQDVRMIRCGDIVNQDSDDGMYYKIQINNSDRSIMIWTDWLNLLSVYYSADNTHVYVSSSFSKISQEIGKTLPDKLYYAELALFYTPLNGRTYFDNIKRLQFGSHLVVCIDGIRIRNDWRFHDLFSSKPLLLGQSISDVSDLFISNWKKYQSKKNMISLTGGFDGRANVACAHHYGSSFETYSYGRIGYSDVDVPVRISSKLPVKYNLINLNKDYIENHYLDSVLDYLSYTGGQNGFSYPQTLFSMKTLSNDFRTIITGFIGSELLRSSREPDPEILSQCVCDAILGVEKSNNHAYHISDNLVSLDLVNDLPLITDCIDELYDYLERLPSELSQNQKFSVFMFELINAYVFGPWISNGLRYAQIRNPYLDREFVNFLVRTKVSGFYDGFLEKNMVRRREKLKFYGYVIRNTWPEIGRIPISKGYSPAEVLYPMGTGILYAKVFRKNKTEKHGLDKLGTISGARMYILNNFAELENHSNLNLDLLNKMLNENAYTRDLAFWALSKYAYTNSINKH